MSHLGRWIILGLLAVLPWPALASLESAQVTLDYVAKRAEQRAHKPFHSPRADLPDVLKSDKLDYDKYREIEFRHDKALWAAENLPFRVEFFHPGYLYQEPVHVNEFTLTHVQPIRFVQDFFNYRSLKIARTNPRRHRLRGLSGALPDATTDNRWDELGAFLGASYFRLLGKGQRYGLSARGLALDCGEPDRPEEFPIFTDWWLGKPHRRRRSSCAYTPSSTRQLRRRLFLPHPPGKPPSRTSRPSSSSARPTICAVDPEPQTPADRSASRR